MEKDLKKFSQRLARQQFVKYLDSDEIETLTASLGHTISQEFEGQELILVGVLKGSAIFTADLCRHIKNVRLTIDFVQPQSMGRSDKSQGTILFNKDLSVDVRGKNVLIVEEIIDSGRALDALQQRIRMADPKSLKIMSLFDKPYRRTTDIQPDYLGKKIEDHFLVGHGLDLEEFGRNIEDIYYLKYPQ